MKTILTLLFVLFIGLAAQAQSSVENTQIKVTTIEMGIVTSTSFEKIDNDNKIEVARLYKFKNSRIKKALKFTTKRNRAKMA